MSEPRAMPTPAGVRATRSPLPDDRGLRASATACASYCEVYGGGRARRSCCCRPGRSSTRALWKAQVPYLARHFRVVTFDGRGNGRSGPARGAAAYAGRASTPPTRSPCWTPPATERAVLVGVCPAARWAPCSSPPTTPSGSPGSSRIAPGVRARLRRIRASRGARRSTRSCDDRRGLGEVQPPLLARATTTTSSSSSSRRCSPSRTRPSRSRTASAWGSTTTPEALADADAARSRSTTPEPSSELLRAGALPGAGRPRRPTTELRPHAQRRALAELTGGRAASRSRAPATCRTRARPGAWSTGSCATSSTPRRRRGAARGRAARPATAARAVPVARRSASATPGATWRSPTSCARCHPDLQIDWLAQDPVTAVLEARGERVHPAQRRAGQRVGAHRGRGGEHDLHAFQAIRRMDEILVANFMVFHDVVRDEPLRPVDRRRGVGRRLLPAREPGAEAAAVRVADRLRRLAADARRRRARGGADRRLQRRDDRARARYPRVRDRSIFVGDPDDIVPATFGAGPAGDPRVDRARTSTSPATSPASTRPRSADRDGLRAELGYARGRAGLRGHGRRLRGRGAAAASGSSTPCPLARAAVPELRFVVVTGPRIDPASLPRRTGSRCAATCPTSTGTSRPATSRSSRAG